MLFFVIAAVSIILFIILEKFKPVKIIFLRSMLLPSLCLIFILCLIFFSSTAVKSAVKGIELWLYVVFPSLFPFFVGAELLYRSGFIKAAGIILEPVMRPIFNIPGCGSFALLLGITSGYPVGAKITAGLRQEKLISKTEAERLLTFTNNSGPLFIIGAVSVGMFKLPQVGLLLLFSHIGACLTVGFIFRFYKKNKISVKNKKNTNIFSRFKNDLILSQSESKGKFAGMFGEAIKDSMMTIIAIGGFIVFFSVIINVLFKIGAINALAGILAVVSAPVGISKDILTSLISGFFEITTGTNMASNSSNTSLVLQLSAASMIIGWAGLSVHSQVISIISRTDISFKPYLAGKFLQGAISALYTFALLRIARPSLISEKSVFSVINIPAVKHWYENYIFSAKATALIGIIFLVTALFILLFKKKRLQS
ncbi:MAG TPA: sporulation integral membrane protein YlbJ [Clostridia bacterium]|nr:sporulation integral membrane protein YlbJ [Clostridia bacterium]